MDPFLLPGDPEGVHWDPVVIPMGASRIRWDLHGSHRDPPVLPLGPNVIRWDPNGSQCDPDDPQWAP